MYTRPELMASFNDLDQLAEGHAVSLEGRIAAEDIPSSVAKARTVGNEYFEELEGLLKDSLRLAAERTLAHFVEDLALGLTPTQIVDIAREEVEAVIQDSYYGLTLADRFKLLRRHFTYNVVRSSNVGKNAETRKANIVKVFNKPYPFGAQTNLDKRLLLSEQVRTEHRIALKAAELGDLRLVKWRLSHHHDKEDVCDDLAEAVDPAVVDALEELGWDVDPAGVYFVENVPAIPHPNCQCEIAPIQGGKVGKSFVKRTRRSIRQLVKRILQLNK